jgi:ribose transport system substrate-binding protein
MDRHSSSIVYFIYNSYYQITDSLNGNKLNHFNKLLEEGMMIPSNIFKLLLINVVIISAFWTIALPQEKIKIAVLPKNNESLFWKSVHAGVNIGAAISPGLEIIWKAPRTESDKEQIAIIDQCIKEGVSGIILSPISYDALSKPVSKAMKKKIPVLIFDSALKGKAGQDFISFVGIDNRNAGIRAGEQLAKILKDNGKVIMLRYVEGQANTTEREEGFLEEIAKHKNIQVIVKDHYAGGTVDEAIKVSTSLLGQLKEADGIFCPNEKSTIGMLLALRNANVSGKIFIGFDASTPQIEALKKGEISALIAQDPSRIGFVSVKTIIDYIHGKKIPPKIDINIHVITRENVNDPQIKKIYSMSSREE